MYIRILFFLFVMPIQVFAFDTIQGTFRVNQATECNDGTRIASTYDVVIDSQGTYSTSGYYTYRNDTELGVRTITYVAGQFSCSGTFSQNQRTLRFEAATCAQSDLADFSLNRVEPVEIISDYNVEIEASLNNAYFQFPAGNRNLILYNDPAEIETLTLSELTFSRVCVRQGDGVKLRNSNTVPLPIIEPGITPEI